MTSLRLFTATYSMLTGFQAKTRFGNGNNTELKPGAKVQVAAAGGKNKNGWVFHNGEDTVTVETQPVAGFPVYTDHPANQVKPVKK